jgi:glycosyltransferase involved in cell wall biosynthesis
MDRACYEPAVVVWNYREQDAYVQPIRDLDVPLYAFPIAQSSAAKLVRFRGLLRALQPEVVHSYSFFLNFAAAWAVKGTRALAVGSIRSDFTWEKCGLNPWLGRVSGRWPRHQICNNLSAIENVRRAGRLFVPQRLSMVRNGIDLERFRTAPFPTVGRPCIVGVGSLLPVKRWDHVLAAALALKKRGFDFRVRIVGHGPLRGALQQQAEVLGIADSVQFTGYSDDIPGFLASATFLVHPSDSEGCPNAVMEAMACGRAVVAMDVGDVSLLVEDGKTGFVVPHEDDRALIDRMAVLLTNPGLCQRMGEAGRARAEREFGLDRLVTETLAAYRIAGWEGPS